MISAPWPLRAEHVLASFCYGYGVESMDNWLKQRAMINHCMVRALDVH